MKRTLTLVVMLGTCLPFALCAQEKRISRTELPAAVLKTVDAQTQGATIMGYTREVENGRVEYEVESKKNGRSRDISIATDGHVLEVEEEVALDSLPAVVQDGLKKQAGKGTISKVESLSKGNKLVAYEAAVKGGAVREVQVGPDGKPLRQKQ